MDEEVWCDLDLQLPANDVAGLHRAAHDDPFWPALADGFDSTSCTASFLSADDIDITGSASDKVAVANDMVLDVDTSYFAAEQHQDLLMVQQDQTYSSSPSSKRSFSVDDSAGTTSSPFSFALDGADAALTAGANFDPFAGDDAAIMRAMMAILSSASPSSSESSSPPQSQELNMQQAAAVHPPRRGGNNNNNGHVVAARSINSFAVGAEKTNSAGGGRQQQDDASRAAPSTQVYHMMSERKRREKLNDSFQTLRSLLPPCSKKDKTTVLINAASYLKKLEAEVSELEEKNAKLERHVPRDDGGAATARAAQSAAHRRAKVQVSRVPSGSDADRQVNLTVMVMVECDIVELVLHVLERLRWTPGVSVLSVDADTYSPQVLLKAIASIKLQITDCDCWNEASFHEAMKKVVHDATSSPTSACASTTPPVAAA